MVEARDGECGRVCAVHGPGTNAKPKEPALPILHPAVTYLCDTRMEVDVGSQGNGSGSTDRPGGKHHNMTSAFLGFADLHQNRWFNLNRRASFAW